MLTPNQLYLILPAVVTALIGSTVQFVIKTPDQTELSTSTRVASTFGGWVLTVIIAAIFIVIWNWHWLFISLGGLVFGFVAETGVRKLIEYMRAAKDLEDFARRGKRAYDAFKQDQPPTPPTNPPTP